MPELPDVTIYVERLQAQLVGNRWSACDWSARSCCGRSNRRWRPLLGDGWWGAPSRKADRAQLRGRPLPGDPPDDCPGGCTGSRPERGAGQDRPGGFRLPGWDAASHGGKPKEASCTSHSQGRRAGLQRSSGAGWRSWTKSSLAEFGRVLRSESHTLKRALTDPDLFSGVGNAYSDEILHRARYRR